MAASRIITTAWRLAVTAEDRRFRQALRNPAAAQAEQFGQVLRRFHQSAFGRAHGSERIRSIADFQAAIPLRRYEDFVPWLQRIAEGESGVLGPERVDSFLPTSGSQGARKCIPSHDAALAAFQRGLAPWMADSFRRHPACLGGPAYWSISPQVPLREENWGRIPIAFSRDSSYLGRRLGPLIEHNLVHPQLDDIGEDLDRFRYRSLLALVACGELRFISIWHPSFLQLLLDALPQYWGGILAELRCLSPRRAQALANADPRAPLSIWPHLACLSAWDQGAARWPAAQLRARFPAAIWQSKGLLATEGIVSLPYAKRHPLALRSHFFEFLDEHGRCLLAHQLRNGADYEVVLSGANGLCRYRLGDRVLVEGRLGACPSLRFLGRSDGVCDCQGEKLSPAFVQQVFDRVLLAHCCGLRFALLAPRPERDGYRCFLSSDTISEAVAQELEAKLGENPHYRYCRQLGQLQPVSIVRVAADAHQRYLRHQAAAGQLLGDIKPSPLSAEPDWRCLG
jgi:hypothetical protein